MAYCWVDKATVEIDSCSSIRDIAPVASRGDSDDETRDNASAAWSSRDGCSDISYISISGSIGQHQ